MSRINQITYSYHRQDRIDNRQRNNKAISIKTVNPMQTPVVGFISPNFSCVKVRHSVLRHLGCCHSPWRKMDMWNGPFSQHILEHGE